MLDKFRTAASSALIEEDRKQSLAAMKKGRPINPYALSQKLSALDEAHAHAESQVSGGKSAHDAIKSGISKHFDDRTHDNLQKAVDKVAGLKTWAKSRTGGATKDVTGDIVKLKGEIASMDKMQEKIAAEIMNEKTPESAKTNANREYDELTTKITAANKQLASLMRMKK